MFATVALAALLSNPVAVPVEPEQTPLEWVILPQATPEDYPVMAGQLALNGYAFVECEADPQGVPVNCLSLTSSPAHLGFDTAAINVVQRGRVSPASIENTDTRRFTVRIPFKSRPFETRPEWKGPEPTEVQINAGRQFARNTVMRHPPIAVRMRQVWQLDRLPAEQRDALTAWLNELAPSREKDVADTAIAVARVLAVHGVDSWPNSQPENHAEWRRDMALARPDNSSIAMKEIARRYCATFACVSD